MFRTLPSDNPPVSPDTHGAETYIEIRKDNNQKTGPCPAHVRSVEAAGAVIGSASSVRFRDAIFATTNQVTQRVTSAGPAADRNNVGNKHQCAEADAETPGARGRIHKPESFPRIVGQNEENGKREIEKKAMHVLNDQRQLLLAEIRLARLADGAAGRISPECLVV